MKNCPLKKDILDLKKDLVDLESCFNEFARDIEIREQRWKKCEKKLDDLKKVNEGTCTLNIGGKRYEVSLHVLKSRRGTMFYKQIFRGEIKNGTTTFYDRDATYFPVILNFLRTGKLKSEKMNDEEKEELLTEAQFYEIQYIIETLMATASAVEFTKFEANSTFEYNGQVVGTNNVKDLEDKSLTKGICTDNNGIITITFNREVEFEEIAIGGYNGNSLAWHSGNGKGANILTSKDMNTWTTVGTINEYGAEIYTIKVKKSKAKYIRFTHNSYLGIGYLEIKESGIGKKK
jgi:hypothetical protein